MEKENKRLSIAPKVMQRTVDYLKAYKKQHPKSQTPMRDAWLMGVNSEPSAYDRARYVRAARRLRWDVCIDNGNIIENGITVWTTVGH